LQGGGEKREGRNIFEYRNPSPQKKQKFVRRKKTFVKGHQAPANDSEGEKGTSGNFEIVLDCQQGKAGKNLGKKNKGPPSGEMPQGNAREK